MTHFSSKHFELFTHRYGKAVATAYVQGILTSEPCEISLLFFLWYLHSGGGKTQLLLILPVGFIPLKLMTCKFHVPYNSDVFCSYYPKAIQC